MGSILITGGTGFIGAYLTQHLAQSNHKVFLATRAQSKIWRFEVINMDSSIEFVQISFKDKQAWKEFILKNRISTVIHLATFGSYPNQIDLNQTVQTNLYESLSFLEACIESNLVTRFISAGSGSEYSLSNQILNEESPLRSPTIYGRTKAAFGLLAEEICKETQVSFCHLRLFTIYGPFEEPSRIIPSLVLKGMKGSLPKLSNPNNSRDFTYVGDLYNLICKAIEAKRAVKGIYNVSSAISVNLAELVAISSQVFSINVQPIWDEFPSRNFDNKVWAGSNEKAKVQFGWSPQISLEEGMLLFQRWIKTVRFKSHYLE